MTVSSEKARTEATGDGVTAIFPYDFRILSDAHISVTVGGVTKALTADYTVTDVGESAGGNVVFEVASIPADDAVIVFYRNIPYTQLTDLSTGGTLDETTLEDVFDKLTMIAQQLKETISRCPSFVVGSLFNDIVFPELVASKILRVNPAGTALIFDDISTVDAGAIVLPVTIANGGTTGTSAAEARTNLGLAIGTNVQAYNALLAWVVANMTAAGQALLDDANAAAQLVTLGAAKSGANADITSLSAITTPLSITQGGTGSSGESGARTELSVEYITSRVNIKDRGAVLDGATNDLSVIQTCLAEVFALGGGTIFIPPSANGAYIGSKLVIDNNYVCLEGIEQERSTIISDQNIVMIEIGHYVYTGADDFSGDNVYGVGLKNLHIKNTNVTKTNTMGVNLLSSAYADYHNLHIDGCRTGIVIQVIGGWLKIKNILVEGTGLVYGVRVSGNGYSAGYNTTGLEFAGISVIGFSGAGFSCYGNVFGDMTVNQLNLYGDDATASGISLTSVGSKFYAHKITFNTVDVDGTCQYGIYANGVSNMTVCGLAIGGAVGSPWVVISGSNNKIISDIGLWMSTQSPGDPGAPTIGGILYLRDNGVGKMQYVARFPTGAIQVIATEP